MDFHINVWDSISSLHWDAVNDYCKSLDSAVYPLPECPPLLVSRELKNSPAYQNQLAEYERASEERERDPRFLAFVQQNPAPQSTDFMLQNCPQNLLDEALRKGTKLMSEALGRETYRQRMFLQVPAALMTKMD